MAFLDPPYNVRVKRVVGRGRTKHAEFAMASGEMSASEFTAFLEETLGNAARVSRDGAVHFVCMDWRHISELIEASREIYGEMLNLVVWEKTNAGQGSFYRSAHELVGVFRVGAPVKDEGFYFQADPARSDSVVASALVVAVPPVGTVCG